MHQRILIGSALVAAVLSPPAAVAADPKPVQVGAGSYLNAQPQGAKTPPNKAYVTKNWRGPIPTNAWHSSVAWMPFSERQYPHPLAVQAEAEGLRIWHPGQAVVSNEKGIFASMPVGGGDLILGHAGQARFPDARLHRASDWFVDAAFSQGDRRMNVSYGHGSPFVFATFQNGGAKVTFASPPKIWRGADAAATVGVTVAGKHYGLFGPSGSEWRGVGGKVLTNDLAGKRHMSVAALPDNRPETLKLFAAVAHHHVTDTKAVFKYDHARRVVRTEFQFTVRPREGAGADTLFALYPHQWRHTKSPLLTHAYPSVRGPMKLVRGSGFTTEHRLPGLLPDLPATARLDREQLASLLAAELKSPATPPADTYGGGKWLGRTTALAGVARQIGRPDLEKQFVAHLKQNLAGWLSADAATGTPTGRRQAFYYDKTWGTLIGYPASFGSDDQLNDHHFHYGYIIRAAAAVARRDPAWARRENWGGMVEMLIGDVASRSADAGRFPRLRCFDVYAGHSWASGHARFGDGNNLESSSEALNAWRAIALWGEATGDRELRDLGLCLFAIESAAVQEYWFNAPRAAGAGAKSPQVAGMIWGGKTVPATWFSGEPEHIYGINWLPITPGSLYLGQSPARAGEIYESLLKARGGPNWKAWADLIWMYRALSDPTDALSQYEGRPASFRFEAGNSHAMTLSWLQTLADFGTVDASAAGDYPWSATFRRGRRRTYAASNMGGRALAVRFSDGFTLTVEPGTTALASREVPDGD